MRRSFAFPCRGISASLVLLAGLACGGTEGSQDEPSADTVAALPEAQVMGEPTLYRSPDGALVFALPERWAGEVTVRETTPADLEWTPPAPERVFQFLLQPRDPRFATENLFHLFLYDPAVWDGMPAPLAASVGTEVERVSGRVYVLGPPLANPFPEGSLDQGRFERFRMSPDEVREALRP